MSALAPSLPRLTATVGTDVQRIADGVFISHPGRDDLRHSEAVLLTGEIRAALRDLVQLVEEVTQLIEAAFAMRADQVLGYPSWQDYCAELFAEVRSTKLPVEVRQAVVGALRVAGMSTRAIASGLGVGHQTVARDLQAVEPAGEAMATVTSLDGRTRPAKATKPAAKAKRTKTAIALESLLAAGPEGLTWAELGRKHRWHHGQSSSTLTALHRQGRIVRTEERRGGSGVYVHVARITEDGTTQASFECDPAGA